MLQQIQIPFTHISRKPLGQSKVWLLFAIVTLVLGLMLVGKPQTRAQDTPANDEQLESLLKGSKRDSTIAKIPPAFVAAINVSTTPPAPFRRRSALMRIKPAIFLRLTYRAVLSFFGGSKRRSSFGC